MLATTKVLKAHVCENASFSGMSQNRLMRLLQAQKLQQGQAALPRSIASHGMRVCKAHVWKHSGEVAESGALLEHLRREVCAGGRGFTTLGNVFMDVQSLSSSNPMTMTIEDSTGELTVTGVPDVAILDYGVDSSVLCPFANACAVGDWKSRGRVGKSDAQVMTQAVVLAGDGVDGPPAFVTDLVTGFRCWIVIDSILFRFHPADKPGPPKVLGWLQLSEGVALIRYFIENHGRMAAEDKAELLRSRRGGGGTSSTGGGGASGGGSSSAPPDDFGPSSSAPSERGAGSGRLPPPPSGGSTRGSHGYRHGASAAGGSTHGSGFSCTAAENCEEGASKDEEGHHVNKLPPESPLDSEGPDDGEDIDSPGTGNSLSRAEIAAYQAVAVEEFAMQARIVREIIELHTSHAPN